MRVARSVVAELAREIRLGPPSGLWHVIPAAVENLHVRRRCFKDVEFADTALSAAWSPALCGTGQSKLSAPRAIFGHSYVGGTAGKDGAPSP